METEPLDTSMNGILRSKWAGPGRGLRGRLTEWGGEERKENQSRLGLSVLIRVIWELRYPECGV